MERTILHCDLNSFFASVELLDFPDLRDQPVAVCGSPEARHGIILAKNEAAKAYHIQTAETVWQARKKCPQLVLLPPHHDKYRAYSKKVNAIYEQYTDLVEPFSIDESWLDVTGSLHLFGKDGKGLADELRRRLKAELGLSISVGVSFNKVFAKLGSDYKKPDATTVISRENYQEIVWPLPVTDLLFVGRAAATLLEQYGIHTIGALAQTDPETLVLLLGRQGAKLSAYARGQEDSPVIPARQQPPPKSVGNGMTFRENLVGDQQVRIGLELLSDQVAMRLRKEQLLCSSVQVTIRDANFKTITRQKTLTLPTDLSREITQAAWELVQAAWNLSVPIRMLTVTGQHLVAPGEGWEQLDLFGPEQSPKRNKLKRLEQAVDSIRSKYGQDAISLATLSKKGGLLEPQPDHISFKDH